MATTPALEALAEDFAQRLRGLHWQTDALLIAGSFPSRTPSTTPDVRTVEAHIILIAPEGQGPPPVKATAQSTRAGHTWIRVPPWRSGLMDKNRFYDALSTQPLPVEGAEFNLMAVHVRSRAANGASVRFAYSHRPEIDQRGARAKLANDDWVHDTWAVWLGDPHT